MRPGHPVDSDADKSHGPRLIRVLPCPLDGFGGRTVPARKWGMRRQPSQLPQQAKGVPIEVFRFYDSLQLGVHPQLCVAFENRVSFEQAFLSYRQTEGGHPQLPISIYV